MCLYVNYKPNFIIIFLAVNQQVNLLVDLKQNKD